MNKHTKGPWHVVQAEDGSIEVVGENGQHVAFDIPLFMDALKIAAAPELLGALEQLLSVVEQYDLPLSDPERIAARAAIAKAKGEQA